MTVSRQDNRINYFANGVATNFAYPFRVDQESYMEVFIDDVKITAGWSMTGVGDPNGGEVIFDAAPAEGSVTLQRTLPHVQEVDYTPYDPFPAETHELALDELTFQSQQHHDKLDRSLTAGPSDDGTTDLVLPHYSAYNILLWSPHEKKLINYDLRQCCNFGDGLLPPTDWGREMITGGSSGFVDLDLKLYRNPGGDSVMTNDEMSYNALGSVPGASIVLDINGHRTGVTTIIGTNGMAHAWLSAHAVAGFLVQFDPSWGDDEYTQKTAVVELFEQTYDEDENAVFTSIPPIKTLRITKEVVSSSSTGTRELLTAGAGDIVDLDLNILINDEGAHTFTNDEMSFNVLGATSNLDIKVVLDGNTTPVICTIGGNSQSHGWLSAKGIADFMSIYDPTWGDPDYIAKEVTAQFIVDDGAGGTTDISPVKTIRVTKQTTTSTGGGEGGMDILYMTTAGASDVVDLDLKVYRDTLDNTFTNDEMSFNVFGATAGRDIIARIEGNDSTVIAQVGLNGEAHGWLSANALAEFMIPFDPSWGDDNYTSKPAIVTLYEDDGTGGLTLIPTTKTVRVTKITTTTGAPGSQVLALTTAGSADTVDLDLKVFRDAVGDHVFTNDEMSYNVLGSIADSDITVRLDGHETGAMAVVGPNGEAHGWLSANAIAEFLSQWDSSWLDDAYTQKTTVAQFVSKNGGPVNIPPAKTIRVTKETVTQSIVANPEIVVQEGWGKGAHAFNIYLVTAGYPVHHTLVQFMCKGMPANQQVRVEVRGTADFSWVCDTDGYGNALFSVNADWFYGWGYPSGYSGTLDVKVAGVLKHSLAFTYSELLVG